MKRPLPLVVAASVVLIGAAIWLAFGSARDTRPDRSDGQEPVSEVSPRRPSPQTLSRWLRASNRKLAARAADYRLDAPRLRNKHGQPLPFRERVWSPDRLRSLLQAADGDEIVLDLFEDASFRARVSGRWKDADGIRLAAKLEGRGPRDRFFISWAEGRGRGLVELPSINRAYEIVSSVTGEVLVLEWLYTDVVCATPTVAGADAGIPRAAPDTQARSTRIAPGEVPPLESRPGVAAVIYLDFDGEVVSGTAWASGATINAPAARMNAAEITETWERVSRDFAAFEVNVTTVRSVYDAAPGNRRTHCVVTQDDTAAPGAGGVAYLDSFASADPAYKICWSFIDNSARDCAVVVSHEVGHTLDLSHDGLLASGSEPREEYYAGHGTGPTGWAPVMGVGYYQQLVQWSKGEYTRANNPEDDLAIMTAARRIPYFSDDHGGSSSAATALVSGVAAAGLVERNTDEDYYRLLVGSGPQPVSVSLPTGTMLDVELKIFAEDGTLLETVNPPDALPVSTVLNFPTARPVYLRVAGTGKPQVLATGYSSYSSLGAYTLAAGSPLPEKVTSVLAKPFSDSAIDVAWSAAPAATAYIVRRDGADIATTSALSCRDSGLSELTSYTYTVVATNGVGAAPPSDPATAVTLSWSSANPYGFRVTSPASLLSAETSEFLYSGQMGAGLEGAVIRWTNAGRGLSGTFAGQTNWKQLIPLGPGTNRVVFSANYQRPVGTNTLAYDAAGDAAYAGGAWNSGANGGFGFGAWSNTTTTTNAVHFVTDNFASTNMNVGTFLGFALRASGGSTAAASRSFARPLASGDSFILNFDNNGVDPRRSVGFALFGDDGKDRFSFFARGGSPGFYAIGDAAGPDNATTITVGTQGLLPVVFTLTSSNTYRLTAGTNPPVTGSLAGDGSLAQLRIFNQSAGPGVSNTFYVGDLSVQAVVTTNQRLAVAAPFIVQSASLAPPLIDGLPAAWWQSHGIPPEERVASADRDGDGFSNAQEQIAGTDPGSAGSRLAILDLSRSGSSVSVSWATVPGKTYQIQTKSALGSGPWVDREVVTAGPEDSSLVRSVDLPGVQGYVRVLVRNP